MDEHELPNPRKISRLIGSYDKESVWTIAKHLGEECRVFIDHPGIRNCAFISMPFPTISWNLNEDISWLGPFIVLVGCGCDKNCYKETAKAYHKELISMWSPAKPGDDTSST